MISFLTFKSNFMSATMKEVLIVAVGVLLGLVIMEVGKRFILNQSFEEALENELQRAA